MRDAIMSLFHKRPYRCRSCRRRFYGPDDELPDELAEDPAPNQKAH
jgi:hypothetical protein